MALECVLRQKIRNCAELYATYQLINVLHSNKYGTPTNLRLGTTTRRPNAVGYERVVQ